MVAQATLSQMVQAVFGRVPKDVRSKYEAASTATAAPDSNRGSVDKKRVSTESGDALSPGTPEAGGETDGETLASQSENGDGGAGGKAAGGRPSLEDETGSVSGVSVSGGSTMRGSASIDSL